MKNKINWDTLIGNMREGQCKCVSWRYRDERFSEKMYILVRRGLFTVESGNGRCKFTRTAKPYDPKLAPNKSYPKGHENY